MYSHGPPPTKTKNSTLFGSNAENLVKIEE